MLGIILVMLAVLMLIGALPRWPYNRRWGYYPITTVGVIFAVLVILLLMGMV